MGDKRKWSLGGGTTIETNIEGFEPMGAESMAAALVAAGFITEAEADAAMERRRLRHLAQQDPTA